MVVTLVHSAAAPFTAISHLDSTGRGAIVHFLGTIGYAVLLSSKHVIEQPHWFALCLCMPHYSAYPLTTMAYRIDLRLDT